MGKRPAAKSLHRCLTSISISSPKHEYSKALGVGLIVDLGERVSDGVTLRDLVAERDGKLPDGWFEEIAGPDEPRPQSESETET